ncbi:MAG: lipoprotein-releasing ABC transporter permease subunit [Zoogloeaceae bacterium]|nr:lipoprotein-releasing ABC transporter permease subunit [Zoogloeaceae bacterium]
MSYEILVGLRYTRAKRRNHFISFISLISIVILALGVTALIAVLSVMNGFQTELRTSILSVVSHVQVYGMDGNLSDWETVVEDARTHPDVVAAAPFIEAQSMLMAGRTARGVIVRGILPTLEDTVADFSSHMTAGKLDALKPGEFGIVLGSELARGLRVQPGDKVTLVAPQTTVTPAGVIPRMRSFTVTGIFEVGWYEYDSGLALIDLQDAQRLYNRGDSVSGVRLKLQDLFTSARVIRELARIIRADAYLADWTRSHASFFRAIQIEKNVMFFILSLIVLVAALSLVSTLVMTVIDKEADIAILRTLGARPGSIMAIFIVQGAVIVLVGIALGIIGGVALALNAEAVMSFFEGLLGTQILAKDIYNISSLPSELQWKDVWSVSGIALVLALLATLYPSWRAAKINPAEALRYE